MRTIVDLTEEQVGALARLCVEQKISRAEAIRRAQAAAKETAEQAVENAKNPDAAHTRSWGQYAYRRVGASWKRAPSGASVSR